MHCDNTTVYDKFLDNGLGTIVDYMCQLFEVKVIFVSKFDQKNHYDHLQVFSFFFNLQFPWRQLLFFGSPSERKKWQW